MSFHFKNKNILLISPEAWGTSFLSKHHYARALSKYNGVWFLNPPYAGKHQPIQPENTNKNLTVISDHFIRGLRFLPSFMQRMIMKIQIAKLEKITGVNFDVVWSFDNSRYFHLDCFTEAYKIHHVVDDHMNYHLDLASKSADICLGVTDEITKRLRVFNRKAFVMPHGFAPFSYTNALLPLEKGKTNIAYVGNLLLRAFDPALVERIACAFENSNIHLIGSYGEGNLNATPDATRIASLKALSSLNNVFLHGEKTHEDAFTLASQADVQIVLYFNNKEVMSNSSKLPFYFYNSNVVVSNFFTAYAEFSMLRMASTPDEFLVLLGDTLAHLSDWNSDERKRDRKSFALSCTYENLITRIENVIDSN